MGFTVLFREENQAGPVPASGTHAEVLAELDTSARALIRLIELERAGVYDGFGHSFWTESDPVLSAAQRLVKLAEQRIGELRDRDGAAPSSIGQR